MWWGRGFGFGLCWAVRVMGRAFRRDRSRVFGRVVLAEGSDGLRLGGRCSGAGTVQVLILMPGRLSVIVLSCTETCRLQCFAVRNRHLGDEAIEEWQVVEVTQ